MSERRNTFAMMAMLLAATGGLAINGPPPPPAPEPEPPPVPPRNPYRMTPGGLAYREPPPVPPETQRALDAMGDPLGLLPHTATERRPAMMPRGAPSPEVKGRRKGTRRERKARRA